MKTFLLTLCLILTTSPVFTQDQENTIDEATKKVCNRMMLDFYYDILDAKDKYPELQDFGEAAMYENKHGIYTIIYQAPLAADKRQKTPYAFGVTIDRIEDQTFKPQKGSFNFSFPALNLKISGYQQKHLLRSQYNIMPLVDKHGVELARHQQNYLPLRLYLRTLQDTYKVKQDIEFEVILSNVSKRHMVVKGLGPDTLFFVFNNQFWGTRPSPGHDRIRKKEIILKSGESLTMRFKGESFQRPREFEIACTYRMSINGVNPSGVLKVQVVRNDPEH